MTIRSWTRAEWEQAAGRAGLPLSDWIRRELDRAARVARKKRA